MPDLDPTRLQDCRFDVRRALYARPTAGVDVDSIRHQLTRWAADYSTAEIRAAATFLCGMEPPQAKLLPKTLGAVDYWQITSAGIIAHESNA